MCSRYVGSIVGLCSKTSALNSLFASFLQRLPSGRMFARSFVRSFFRTLVRSFVRSFVRTFGRAYVRPSRNVRLCFTSKRLNLVVHFFAHICKHTGYLRLLIFIQIVSVPDLHFQGKRFESDIDRTNIAIANTESRMWPFDLHIYI